MPDQEIETLDVARSESMISKTSRSVESEEGA